MSKKVFTVLLLAVFMLAQFSMASAATVAGDASITALPDFSSGANVDLDWAVTGMAAGTKNILVWGRLYPAAVYDWNDCQLIATINGTSDASGTFTYNYATTVNLAALSSGDVVEFALTVDDQVCGVTATPPAVDSVMGSNYVDDDTMDGDYFNPPSLNIADFDSTPVSCNTFEMWSVVSDKTTVPAGDAYSGFDSWNPSTTGTFAAPAPIGADAALFSWVFTFPATASGAWELGFNPTDAAGNEWGMSTFRDGAAPVNVVGAGELADCADFTDVAGHANEVYIRYLADLGLISGFADGSFGPDNNLTRAEAATLFEISNGISDTDPGFGTPPVAGSACDFSDVSASDWFAGWVWQACEDGFMNGVGGDLFDPNNLLTRGQVVTIFNNIYEMGGGTGDYLDFANGNVLSQDWTLYENPYLREAAWTDISVGAYYAIPVLRAYGIGVAEGTSATTFSPDQAATRGEFAKMLYRAISQQ